MILSDGKKLNRLICESRSPTWVHGCSPLIYSPSVIWTKKKKVWISIIIFNNELLEVASVSLINDKTSSYVPWVTYMTQMTALIERKKYFDQRKHLHLKISTYHVQLLYL